MEEEVDIFTTGILVQEVLNGIIGSGMREKIRADLDRFILVMPTLETHVLASEIYDGCRKNGIVIRSIVDCLVAALALQHNLSVLENNRDYPSIAKVFPLKIEPTNHWGYRLS